MYQMRWVCVAALLTLMVLPSTPVFADWDEGDDFKMHFPQLPDPLGWDVSASAPSKVADDWQCSETGYVSDIHIWGSWYDDNPDPSVNILGFHLEIWSDQPANPPTIPFSHPLARLWQHDFPAGSFIERIYGAPSPQGFFDPVAGVFEANNHLITWQYNFFVPEDQAFIQEEGTIYWLVVQVTLDGAPIWGWKTTLNHWNDDSVYLDSSNPGSWQELFDPTLPSVPENSLDQAFVITGEALSDWGDAPDVPFPTLKASNGARHVIDGVTFLGGPPDAEPDGQPNATATGDDLAGSPDEDGVQWVSPLIPGFTAFVDVTASVPGMLDAWIDFNANGSWADPGEQIFLSFPLNPGSNQLMFYVPPGSSPGATFARFRFSTAGGLSYTGSAPDGEVEDYVVSIQEPLKDWGDAPDPTYPTLSTNNGAVHTLVETVYLGAGVPDAESNGQPDAQALGDDHDGSDDEDGVVHSPGTIVPSATIYVKVTASTTGFINAWVDFNGDGDWNDTGEQVFTNAPVVAGANSLSFTTPTTVVTPTFARYRFDTVGSLAATGPATDGEVEDYWFETPIFVDGFESGDTLAWSSTTP